MTEAVSVEPGTQAHQEFVAKLKAGKAYLDRLKSSSKVEDQISEKLVTLDGYRFKAQMYADIVGRKIDGVGIGEVYLPKSRLPTVALEAVGGSVAFGLSIYAADAMGRFVGNLVFFFVGGLQSPALPAVGVLAPAILVATGSTVFAVATISNAVGLKKLALETDRVLVEENTAMLAVRTELRSLSKEQIHTIQANLAKLQEIVALPSGAQRNLPSTIELNSALIRLSSNGSAGTSQ